MLMFWWTFIHLKLELKTHPLRTMEAPLVMAAWEKCTSGRCSINSYSQFLRFLSEWPWRVVRVWESCPEYWPWLSHFGGTFPVVGRNIWRRQNPTLNRRPTHLFIGNTKMSIESFIGPNIESPSNASVQRKIWRWAESEPFMEPNIWLRRNLASNRLQTHPS